MSKNPVNQMLGFNYLKPGSNLSMSDTLIHTFTHLFPFFNQIKQPIVSAVLFFVTPYLHTFTPSHQFLEKTRGIVLIGSWRELSV